MSYIWSAENPLIDGTDYPQVANVNELRNIFDHISNYRCSVKCTTNPSISNAVSTIIPFDTVEYDPNSNWNPSTYQYTVPLTGYYRITASLDYSANVTGLRSCLVIKNSVETKDVDFAASSTYGSSSTTTQSSVNTCELSLSTGDLIEVHGYQTSGGSLPLSSGGNHNWFSISYQGS